MPAPAPAPRPRTADAAPAPRGSAVRWAAASLWALVVAAVLWTSGPEEPPSWSWLQAVERAGGDKLVHAGLFAVQAWLLCRCRPASRAPRWLAACFAGAAAYGVLTEVGQLLAAGRDASAGDAVADAVGAGLGVAWAAWLSRRG